MEEVITAMHEEAMHGYCNSDPDEMLFWNGGCKRWQMCCA